MRLAAVLTLTALLALPASAEDAPSTPKPLPTPRLLGPRTAGPDKDKALSLFGGSRQTEKAVADGLDWLARHANEDGWDADAFQSKCLKGTTTCDGIGKGQHGEDVPCPFDDAITGLATLAFLGAGHLPGVGGSPYGALVEKALTRLASPRDVWSLPIAVEALSEAEAIERKGRWRDAAARGVEQLISARQKDGAWGYCAPYRPGSDVPYTALVVNALVAARDAGIDLPTTLGADVDAWLNTLEEHKGRLAYLVDGRRYGYTPTTSNAHCAIAMRQFLQTGLTGPRHREHLACVNDEKPVWKLSFREVDVPGRGKVKVQIGNLSMYQWWFGTLGEFQEGGADWAAWFGTVKSALLPHQETLSCAKGSWEPKGTYERQTGGRVFATALGVLMLEQPYRHRRLAK